MKKIAVTILGLVFIFTFAMTGVTFADDASQVAQENAALKNQVNSLSNKLEALERQVNVLSNQSAAPSGTTYIPSGDSNALQGITISGFVDTQYNNNFSNHTTNPSVTAGSPGNTLRSFDRNQNTFTVNNIEIDIEKLANPEGGAGFRVDLSAGEDMSFIDGGTLGGAGNSKMGFQQAYVQLVAPLSFFEGSEVFDNTFDLKAGRMVTLAGTEVIEGRDNWNISRGFLFGLAIPFTHTGIRGTYNFFNDRLTTYVGLNNGWDANVDNNTWKTWEAGWAISPTDSLSFIQALYFGPEVARQDGHKRFVMSNVVSYQATEKLAFKGELTFGSQRRVDPSGFTDPVTGASGVNFDNAQWWGIGLHSRYALTDKWGVAARFELFRDKDKFRTQSNQPASLNAGTSTLWSMTYTTDYKIYENLLGRLEYRFDKSNEDNVLDGQHSQSTLGAQLIYSFA